MKTDALLASNLCNLRGESMPLIEVRRITKKYMLGEHVVTALLEANLDIADGEFVALIGPSGSGKSTLMNTLGCLDRPTSGSYRLAGEEVATMNADERALIRNRRIGFVFQNFNLLGRTTALENVELPLSYGSVIPRAERRARATELLRQVGLGERMDHVPSQLSGGQQQRVAIARALVNHPSLILGDEPTGNVDTRTSREIMQLFRRLNSEEQVTVVLVTHDIEVARQADRILVMVDGRIVTDTRDSEEAMESLQRSTRIQDAT